MITPELRQAFWSQAEGATKNFGGPPDSLEMVVHGPARGEFVSAGVGRSGNYIRAGYAHQNFGYLSVQDLMVGLAGCFGEYRGR